MELILQMKKICKSFSKVKVLRDVDFEVRKGEVHALIGENGAGKSTLMKVLSGAISKDSGEIIFDGEKVDITSPQSAKKIGISCIYQELSLIPHFSVASNMFICNEDSKLGFVNQKEIEKKAKEIIEDMDFNLNVRAKIHDLGIGEQYLVEICRCLTTNPKLVIMDEPTSAMTMAELEQFYKVIRVLKDRGISIVFISHKLDEIMEICDRVTVMRDGKFVDCRNISEVTIADIVRLMIGSNTSTDIIENKDHAFKEKNSYTESDVVLEVEHLNTKKLTDISFKAYKGEILGLAGLLGAGKTEILRAIYGADRYDSGKIICNGTPVEKGSPSNAMAHRIGFVPEDRKTQGLMQSKSICDNISIINLDKAERAKVFVDRSKERKLSEQCIEKYNIVSNSINQLLQYLSGGNQQKVVLAKWLEWQPDILLLDEPTRGVDVGAKAEIYRHIFKMAEQGITVIVSSAEAVELLRLCDRILVVYRGQIKGEYMQSELNKEKLLIAVAGE